MEWRQCWKQVGCFHHKMQEDLLRRLAIKGVDEYMHHCYSDALRTSMQAFREFRKWPRQTGCIRRHDEQGEQNSVELCRSDLPLQEAYFRFCGGAYSRACLPTNCRYYLPCLKLRSCRGLSALLLCQPHTHTLLRSDCPQHREACEGGTPVELEEVHLIASFRKHILPNRQERARHHWKYLVW